MVQNATLRVWSFMLRSTGAIRGGHLYVAEMAARRVQVATQRLFGFTARAAPLRHTALRTAVSCARPPARARVTSLGLAPGLAAGTPPATNRWRFERG